MDRRTLRSKKGKPRNSRPYDHQNQSIFGKVCSKVKGLLNPSWLFNVSQWIGNSEEEQPGCSTDVEETVREDNDIVSKSVSHGNKRLRLRFDDHIPSIQSSGTQTWPEQTASQSLYETVPRVPSPSQSSLLENKETIPVLNGDDHSENSEGSASTSGCSSLVSSHKDNNRLVESPFQNIRAGIKRRLSQRDSAASKSGISDLNSSRSLWSSSYSPSATFQRRLSSTNQPNFNLSTFMGPSKLDKSMEKKVSSPFYEGKTTFGGASALRRMPPSVAPYQVDKTLRNQIRVREHQSGDSLEGMSSAAKRILLTLEKMSSPVADAKKMPNTNTSPVDLSLYLKPPKCRRNSQFTPSLSSKGPPIADVSTIAKLATLKNYGVSRLRNPITAESSPVLPSEQKAPVLNVLQPSTSETNNQKSGGGKMKNKLNQHHHSSRDFANSENEVLNEPPLPNIPLPISKLPVINLCSKSERNMENQPSTSFTFSNPIEHEINNTVSTPTFSHKSFKFSSPIEHELPNTSLAATKNVTLLLPNTAKTNVTSSSTWECSECWVRNPASKSSCMACETPKTSEKDNGTKTCSTESKSVVTSTASVSTPLSHSPLLKFSTLSSPTAQLIFGTPKTEISGTKLSDAEQKSQTTSAVSASTSISYSPVLKFSNSPLSSGQFKFGASKTETQGVSSKSLTIDSASQKPTWECSTCWVRNPDNKSKCLACEAARPEKGSTNTGCNSFGSISTLPNVKETWECQSCLVRNPNKETKCMACETPRSTEDASSDKSTKDISVPYSTWECSSCWVRNPMKENKCLACDTLHPNKDSISGLKGTDGFKFSSPIQNSPITFKFGTAEITSQSTTTASTFKFGVTPTTTINTISSSDSLTSSKTSEVPASNNANVVKIPSGSDAQPEQKSDASRKASSDKSESIQQPSLKSEDAKTVTSTPFSAASTGGVSALGNTAVASTTSAPSTFSFLPSTSSVSTVSPVFSFGTSSTAQSSKPASTITTASSGFPFGASSNGAQTLKPGGSNSFGSISTLPNVKETWECQSCLVRNPNKETKCMACETPRSTEDASSGLKGTDGFKFNSPIQNSAVTFKFGSFVSTVPETSTTATFKFGTAENTSQSTTTTSTFKFGVTPTSTIKTVSSSDSLTSSKTAEMPASNNASVFKMPSGSDAQPEQKSDASRKASSEKLKFKSEPIQQPSVKSEDAKTVTSTPFSTVSTGGVFTFGNTAVASTTSAPSTFSFFPSTSSVSTVSPVFSFGTSSTAQSSKPASTVTTASSVFTFGASSNGAQTSKPGGFSFKTLEKTQNAPTVPSASQPAAQGLLPDISASATAPASSGGFVFGAVKTEPQSAASAPFSFGSGAPPSSSASAFSAFQPSQSTNTPFQFGSQPSQSSAPAFGTSTFSFVKAETANQIPSSAPQNSVSAFGSTTSNFAFGSKTEAPNQTSSVPQPGGFLSSTGNFSFSNKNEIGNAVSQAPAPAFGSSTMQPVFGNSTVPAFGASDKPAASGFSFGTSSVFQFGTSNTDKKPAAPSGFTFGTPATSETNNSFTTGFNISTPPSFNFGATSTPAGPFQFAASSSDAVTNQSAPRKYRKAVRRVLRKD